MELVQEEREGNCSKEGSNNGSKEGSASSGKDAASGSKVVKSYIRDDPKVTKMRSKGPTTIAPTIPIRAVSMEDKARPSSGTDALDYLGPLNYVDIKHDDTPTVSSSVGTFSGSGVGNPSSSPKSSDTVLPLQSDVNYTQINHEKTMEFNKKGGNPPH